MAEVFRSRVISRLVEEELLSEEFARNLLSWKNSGFSIDNSVRVINGRTQEGLAQYISRPPVSLKKFRYEPLDDGEEVTVNDRKRAWARLLAKVYEIGPLVCPKCGWQMTAVAVIQDPVEIRDILARSPARSDAEITFPIIRLPANFPSQPATRISPTPPTSAG